MPAGVMSRKRPRLVLGQHAGDVVVDHDHLVDMARATAGANMPMVAEPQPTRMRSSGAPLTIGAPAGLHDDASRRRRSPARPPRLLHSASSASQVTMPSFLLPPVR